MIEDLIWSFVVVGKGIWSRFRDLGFRSVGRIKIIFGDGVVGYGMENFIRRGFGMIGFDASEKGKKFYLCLEVMIYLRLILDFGGKFLGF